MSQSSTTKLNQAAKALGDRLQDPSISGNLSNWLVSVGAVADPKIGPWIVVYVTRLHAFVGSAIPKEFDGFPVHILKTSRPIPA